MGKQAVVFLRVKNKTQLKIQCPGCGKITSTTKTDFEDLELSAFTKCENCGHQINSKE